MKRLVYIAAAALVICACSDDHHSYVANVGDGETTPTMSTINVSTFISDSGYTRYKITTPLWSMYDEAETPFWKFPDGLMLEQYDDAMQVNSTMRCDSARYFTQQRIWQLDGNVVMTNTRSDTFMSQQVFWDQMRREVYSDSFIHIVRTDRVIEGYGFTSDERMSAYSVNRPTGIFPVNRNNADTANARTERPAVTRRSEEAERPEPIPPSSKVDLAPAPDRGEFKLQKFKPVNE